MKTHVLQLERQSGVTLHITGREKILDVCTKREQKIHLMNTYGHACGEEPIHVLLAFCQRQRLLTEKNGILAKLKRQQLETHESKVNNSSKKYWNLDAVTKQEKTGWETVAAWQHSNNRHFNHPSKTTTHIPTSSSSQHSDILQAEPSTVPQK